MVLDELEACALEYVSEKSDIDVKGIMIGIVNIL